MALAEALYKKYNLTREQKRLDEVKQEAQK